MKKQNKKIKHKIQTSYLATVYSSQFLEWVPKFIKIVKAFRRRHPFDSIAFRGSSGAAMAYILSYELKIPLIHVKKNDGSHNNREIEGTISSKRYLIVDDTIASGHTISTIIGTINKNYRHKAKAVGIALYDRDPELKKWESLPVVGLTSPEAVYDQPYRIF